MHIGVCERGNTWLTGDDGGHYALFKLGAGKWLKVSILPENYPGFNVCTIRAAEKKLARHIRERYEGWIARKCNIEGVPLNSNGEVIGLDEENP